MFPGGWVRSSMANVGCTRGILKAWKPSRWHQWGQLRRLAHAFHRIELGITESSLCHTAHLFIGLLRRLGLLFFKMFHYIHQTEESIWNSRNVNIWSLRECWYHSVSSWHAGCPLQRFDRDRGQDGAAGGRSLKDPWSSCCLPLILPAEAAAWVFEAVTKAVCISQWQALERVTQGLMTNRLLTPSVLPPELCGQASGQEDLYSWPLRNLSRAGPARTHRSLDKPTFGACLRSVS